MIITSILLIVIIVLIFIKDICENDRHDELMSVLKAIQEAEKK